VTDSQTPDLRAAARALHDAGLCVLPIKADGTKKPAVSWLEYKVTRTTPEQHDGWFGGDRPRGIAVVYGAVSGNVELIEFEGLAIREGLLDEVTEIMEASGPRISEAWAAIRSGWVTESPRGGRHYRVRVEGGGVPGNTKLASRLAREDEYTEDERQRLREKPNARIVRVLIETRGEGGYGLVEPSGGTVHETGRPYVLLVGGPDTIPTIDAETVGAIRDICHMVDQLPQPEAPKTAPRPAPPRSDGSLRPGDDFEARADWADILRGVFRPLNTRGSETYWGWADGVGGVKATTGKDDRDRLYVFATGSEFQSEVPYSKFGAYALLAHGGDHKAAARELARQGYGSRHLAPVGAPAAAPAQAAAPASPAPEAAAAAGDEHARADEQAQQDVTARDSEGFDYADTFGLPATVRTPYDYRVTGRGVEVLSTSGENWLRVTFAPLVITATFEDPEGDQYVELSWIDRSLGRPRRISRIVSRETAKRGRKLIETLGSAGLPAVEGDARAVEKWLAEFEAGNVGRIPSEQLARWLGWQDDGTFVSSPEDGIKVDTPFEEQRGPARAHARKGTLEGWQETVGRLADYPVPRVAVAAALAAPLLKPLGLNSFTLDISSRSTKGKTTALQVALSVWADPSEHASAMSNWRTTLYAIEKRLNLVRGIVTVFDETMAVTDDTLIDEVLYQLPMNHGKARSGGAFGNMLPWETILLSSGERPALSFTTSQGAAARILGTTIAPFGEGGGPTAAAAREGVLTHHGHAGPEFVQYILSGLAKPNGREGLKEKHRALVDEFRGGGDMTNRRAPMVAVLAFAEALACHIGLLPYEPLPNDVWRSLFTAHNPTDNRPDMALDVLREYVAGHAHELFTATKAAMHDKPPYSGWLGVLSTKDGVAEVALLPERVRKILADAGYSLDAVVGSWVDAEYLKTLKSQRPAHLVPRRFDGARAKCLAFTPEGIGFGDEDEAA
jgi:pyruvate/2-oxoglutarate dehydrogenase complex dihydrolipoamide acyltransferase (E2) component